MDNPIRQIKLSYPENSIIGNLNLNSLRNKVVSIQTFFRNYLDILILAETKLDDTFNDEKLKYGNYEIMGKDRTSDGGGGLMVYMHQ